MVETKTVGSADGTPPVSCLLLCPASQGCPRLHSHCLPAQAWLAACLLPGISGDRPPRGPAVSPTQQLRRCPCALSCSLQGGAASHRTFGAGYIAPHPSIRKDAVDVDSYLQEHQVGCVAVVAQHSLRSAACRHRSLLPATAGVHQRVPGERAAGPPQPSQGKLDVRLQAAGLSRPVAHCSRSAALAHRWAATPVL